MRGSNYNIHTLADGEEVELRTSTAVTVAIGGEKMLKEVITALEEFEVIEADDALHDFGGLHGSKGHDFAAFWVIQRVTELEQANPADYLFVCEYMQDVAEFDSSTAPTRVQLYQLKKKEDGYWTSSTLTGQSGKAKIPKTDKPIWKLLRHIRSVKKAEAIGAFVTNAKFDVALATGQSSVNETRIGLDKLDAAHATKLKEALAAAEGVKPEDVDLSTIELRSEAIAINDMQRHANGVVLEFLSTVAPEHAGMAASLVDTLYVQLKKTARRTEKCASWDELVSRRGFTRARFQKAVEDLKTIPDRASARTALFDKISKDWRNADCTRVLAALTRCAREKVLVGEASRWNTTDLLRPMFEVADEQAWSDQKRFETACVLLAEERESLSADEIKALSIFEMTEWDLNQIPA